MTELVSAGTAREMLSWWEPGELAGRQNEVARDYGTIYAAAPDLAVTVIAQAEQIDKVREVRSIINRLIAYSGEAISTDSTTLAKSIVNKLNDALGDDDD